MSEEKLNERVFFTERKITLAFPGRSKDGVRRTNYCNGELERDEGGERERKRESAKGR